MASGAPLHCEPSSDFFNKVSTISHTCLPNGAALASAVFGTLSVGVWIVALLPQVIRNYRQKGTGGITILFICLWLSGDVVGLTGLILTRQAVWQITLGFYYLSVDLTILSQWLHYKQWKKTSTGASRAPRSQDESEAFLLEDVNPDSDDETPRDKSTAQSNKDSGPIAKVIHDADTQSVQGTTTLHRRHSSGSRSNSALRSALIGASVVQVAQAAAVAFAENDAPLLVARDEFTTTIGLFFTWPPYILFILSRFPLLYNNYKKQSTAGISPLLVLGTFFGNFFYLMGIIFNPRVWSDYDPYGAGGWVGAQGSSRSEWLRTVAPHLIGCSILDCLDIVIAIQFRLYRKNNANVK